MIIKSMSRKTPSYSQLLNYINHGRPDGDAYYFSHGFYTENHKEIVQEYLNNFKLVKQAQNTNALYHEILSLKKQDGLSVARQREILQDLIYQYTQVRANDCLVYGAIHEEDNHIHTHLMISANEIGANKNKRLSKGQFEIIKAKLTEYTFIKYPELERVEAKKRTRQGRRSKQVDREVHYKKRTGQPADREQVRERLLRVFEDAGDSVRFIQVLEAERLSVYQRGNTWGFVDKDTGRKYRLKTLELEEEFSEVNAKINQKAPQKSRQGDKMERPPDMGHENQKADNFGNPFEEYPINDKGNVQEQSHTPKPPENEKEAYKRQLDELAERRKQELEKQRNKTK